MIKLTVWYNTSAGISELSRNYSLDNNIDIILNAIAEYFIMFNNSNVLVTNFSIDRLLDSDESIIENLYTYRNDDNEIFEFNHLLRIPSSHEYNIEGYIIYDIIKREKERTQEIVPPGEPIPIVFNYTGSSVYSRGIDEAIRRRITGSTDIIIGEIKKKSERLMNKITEFKDDKILKTERINYYFPEESYLPVTVINDDYHTFESVEKALEFGFIEDLKTMSWYKKGFNSPYKVVSNDHYFKFHNSNFQGPSKTFLLTEGKRYTFGVEFECSTLKMPQYVYKNLNTDCVRDGSLNAGAGGPEVITGVLNGDSGLKHLQEICKELTQRGSVDKHCGIHVHLGGFDYTKENLVYLYKICLLLEDEIFTLVPQSRRNNEYCRKLDNLNFTSDINQDSLNYKINLNSDLEKLSKYIAFDTSSKTKKLTRKHQHPMGAKCGYRHETPRYCWVNFVPAVFNTRGEESSKTFEIRIHSSTTNYVKTKNWLLLWMGVLWFVENKKAEIKQGLTINDVLYSAYPKRGGKLADYFRRRIELFADKNNEVLEYIQEEVEQIKSIKEQLCV